MSRSLDDLCDRLRPIAKAFTAELTEAEIPFSIIETLRTKATQIAYYAQGREPLEAVNAKRKSAYLYMLKESENRIVTYTLNSKHLTGEALDIVPLTALGTLWWTAPKHTWELIGNIGESYGLVWGGRWGAKDGRLGWDCPHFQLGA
jgi:hypothetical protein